MIPKTPILYFIPVQKSSFGYKRKSESIDGSWTPFTFSIFAQR